MQPEKARPLAPSGRGFLLLVVVGGVVGVVLVALDAPFWVFYIAPMAMTPIVLRELRALGRVHSPTPEKEPGRTPRSPRQEVADIAAPSSGEEARRAPQRFTVPSSAAQAQRAAQRFAVSQEIFIRRGEDHAILVRTSDWDRYVKGIRMLEEISRNWIAAAWALIGVAASLAVVALTSTGMWLLFGALAFLCATAAVGCFVADRQLMQRRGEIAERLAREMENVDEVEVVARTEKLPPRPGLSDT